MAGQPIEFPFPLKGLDTNTAVRRQPTMTSPSLLNVRAYDSIADRARGGQRDGLSKYLSAAINGSNAIQRLDQLTMAFDPEEIIQGDLAFSSVFTQANGLLPSSDYWLHHDLTGIIGNGPSDFVTTYPSTTGPKVVSNKCDATAINATCFGIIKSITNPGTRYIMKCTFRMSNASVSSGTLSAGFCFRINTPASSLGASNPFCFAGVYDASGITQTATIQYGPGVFDEVASVLTGFNVSIDHTMELRVNGNLMRLYIDGVLQCSTTQSVNSSYPYLGVMIGASGVAPGSAGTVFMDDLEVYSAYAPTTLRNTELIVVSGGNIYAISPEGVSNLVGSSKVKTSGSVASQAAFQKTYFCDGNTTGYQVYDPVADLVSAWVTSAGKGTLPQGGGSGQTSYALNASAGVVAGSAGAATIVLAASEGDKTGSFAASNIIEVRGSSLAANNRAYTHVSDSYNAGTTTTTIVVAERVATSSAGGTLRIANRACTIMCLYRGRVVLAGLETDPQNWFMSASGNPLDFDYFPTTTSATMAVAGNASNAGKLGDVVTCLAPYGDDLLVIGGDHTLWVMRGDPAAGGALDNISYQTGIAGPRAFAWSPEGVMYFVGANALWRMGQNALPESISRGRVDSLFASINLATHEIHCAWDTFSHGLHIYLVPLSQPTTAPVHIYYDQRTDSFWKDQYPAAQGPTAVHNYDADNPNDKALLVGGWDSYIRSLDSAAKDDDSTAINSYVMYTPVVLSDSQNTHLTRLLPILASNSDPVRLEVYASDSAESAVGMTVPAFARTLAAGRNNSSTHRIGGNTVILRLENDSATPYQWAVETIVGDITVSGRQRHGRI